MTRALAGALLLAALAGCGGGGAESTGGAPATAVAGLEEEGGEGGSGAGGTKGTTAAGVPAPKIDSSLVPQPGAPIERETYSYIGGSRDPFASVLDGASVGPELADLDLLAIHYLARETSASVAVLRDRITGKRYTLREGERAGRARVSDIREKEVTFTIDDYGTPRQVTMVLRTREDNTP